MGSWRRSPDRPPPVPTVPARWLSPRGSLGRNTPEFKGKRGAAAHPSWKVRTRANRSRSRAAGRERALEAHEVVDVERAVVIAVGQRHVAAREGALEAHEVIDIQRVVAVAIGVAAAPAAARRQA